MLSFTLYRFAIEWQLISGMEGKLLELCRTTNIPKRSTVISFSMNETKFKAKEKEGLRQCEGGDSLTFLENVQVTRFCVD